MLSYFLVLFHTIKVRVLLNHAIFSLSSWAILRDSSGASWYICSAFALGSSADIDLSSSYVLEFGF